MKHLETLLRIPVSSFLPFITEIYGQKVVLYCPNIMDT